MNPKLTTAITETIALATKINEYWNRELPKRHINYPFIQPNEESGPPPAEENTLQNLLASFDDGTVYKLALIMYLGRGDFGPSEIPQRYERLQITFPTSEAMVARIMKMAQLAQYLKRGLSILTSNCIDLDSVNRIPAGV